LDTDATLVETRKGDALWSYKHFKAYQPLNVWWAEQELGLHTEFRDGNVPAGTRLREVLEKAFAALPPTVHLVPLRSDAAGNVHDLVDWCRREIPGRTRMKFVSS